MLPAENGDKGEGEQQLHNVQQLCRLRHQCLQGPSDSLREIQVQHKQVLLLLLPDNTDQPDPE